MFDDLMRQIAETQRALADCPRSLSDAQRVQLLGAAEGLKCTATAAQATTTADLDESQRAAQVAAGVRAARVGEGIAEQVGLARRESPTKGARLLGLAKVLHREMPHTLALMRAGRLNEWRATILARETACLSLDDRAEVDRRLCGTGAAATMSDLRLTRAAKRLACELDPASVAERARRAEAERQVTIRPAPDTMCWVSALLPVKQGVSIYATLLAAAAAARAKGAQRTKGQVMADTLVERVTGAPADEPVKVEVKLVMSDRALFDAADDAAHLEGYGPVPAPWARAFVKDAMRATRVWIRRLYTSPSSGQLVSMDSRARLAPEALAEFVATRDQDLCRTPWCGAPIRHIDHIRSWEHGGATAATNLQGLCERCNHAKQAPGWTATPRIAPDGTHTVETTTPTGHRHHSRAPDPPGPADYLMPLERVPTSVIV
ncbi:HNH endonuclease signature motif containing protein [Nocardioides sp. cx-173]|uniref:HNH endonuclease n=1 Tax=Nocardioides sp. cx-173 TaxID=2898796 RepID=UPI001E4FF24F|nr:HNH endonuclease signature motif containing protein [Nocardioides sp. cx-173]MCD4524849.1 HNH endonuclease [Nocardioides sp. cx-173]UGB43354.1 HNH endonuclease [Nocardioides sp. cx-173]